MRGRPRAPGAREDGLLEWLDRSFALFPEGTAVEADSVSLRYDALDAIANRVQDVIDRGIPPGSVVAVIGDRVAMIGDDRIFRAGCVFAPLDPRARLRLREIVTDLSPAFSQRRSAGLVSNSQETTGPTVDPTSAAAPPGCPRRSSHVCQSIRRNAVYLLPRAPPARPRIAGA
jgi:acyl-CoA synthetase (AMP-forming)/AMP-acid ligase II